MGKQMGWTIKLYGYWGLLNLQADKWSTTGVFILEPVLVNLFINDLEEVMIYTLGEVCSWHQTEVTYFTSGRGT